MISFTERFEAEEMMDDFSIIDERLTHALDELRWVNRLLGGYATTLSVLRPYLLARRDRTTRILDLGTGIADYPEVIARWAFRKGIPIHITALDANPATVEHAVRTLDRRLEPTVRACINVEVGDALALPYDADQFDVAMAAMFMHHFGDADAERLVGEMSRVAADGILINDLHRHSLAYFGILAPAKVLPVSAMFRNDAPISVMRGFTRADLEDLAARTGLPQADIHWHWAFRWMFSTLHASDSVREA